MKRIILLWLILAQASLFAQEQQMNPILTLVPYLQLNPDARIGGFGDVDIVAPKNYQNAGMSRNPSLLILEQTGGGFSFSFMPMGKPWEPDNAFLNLQGQITFNAKNAIGVKYQYFKRVISYMSSSGTLQDVTSPTEYFLQFSYARNLFNGFSAGIGLKYFNSDLGSSLLNGIEIKEINSYAIDFGLNYAKHFSISDKVNLDYQLAGSLSNFGPKVSYIDEPYIEKDFIPTELSFGFLISPELHVNERVKVKTSLAYQATKLLVPTPPIYDYTSGEILKGYDPDIIPRVALYKSFYDAPGGLKEEIQEINHRIGLETRISYKDQFHLALRYGRFMESWSKGNRKYHTLGMHLGAYGFTIDGRLYLGGVSSLHDKSFALTVGYYASLR